MSTLKCQGGLWSKLDTVFVSGKNKASFLYNAFAFVLEDTELVTARVLKKQVYSCPSEISNLNI